MITTQAETVSGLLERYRQLDKDKDLNKRLRERADELEAAAIKFKPTSDRAALLRDREWLKPQQVPTKDIEKAREYLSKVSTLLEQDPAKIGTPVNDLVKSLEKIQATVSKTTQEVWDEVRQRKKPIVDEAQLKQFERFGATHDAITRIRQLNKVPAEVIAPLNLDEWHAIEKRWNELRQLLEQQPKPDENPDVLRFIDAVNKGGAPLDYLTAEVLKYLQEKQRLHFFRIYKDPDAQ